MIKKNCWEYTNCGREWGGSKVEELGICPAALASKIDGVHGGQNAGRCCWVVAGTLGEGKTNCALVEKLDTCEKCDFYNLVKEEESPHFSFTVTLLKKLKEET